MNFFGQLICRYRSINDLTQEQLATDLAYFLDNLDKINAVTLSRWETGSTSPGIQKKQKILKYLFLKGFLDDREVKNMLKERYNTLETYLEKSFCKQYKSMIGNFPESHQQKRVVHDLKGHRDRQKHLELIVNIGASMTAEGYYRLSAEQLEEWCSYLSTFAIVSDYHGQHAGHYIIIKIKNSVAEDIALHRRSVFTLKRDDFCKPEERGSCFLLTMYARSPKIASSLVTEHYKYLVENSEFIDNILIYTTRDDTLLATKNYGIEIVGSGRDTEYGFTWHGMLSPLEDILFASKIVERIY
ncbi:hypothetical protein MNB_SV-6-1458 [hydrothermal vent metagenome]|uniref:Uncharacterized protein n=1 Tax=hydrothermal vent metagenome TaxID=652676 RepID=A0A1W1BCH8_9ZZZZ